MHAHGVGGQCHEDRKGVQIDQRSSIWKRSSKQMDTPRLWYEDSCTDTDEHGYNRKGRKTSREGDTPQEKLKMIILPYLQWVSEHIQRVCRRIGVRAVFRSHGTLRELVTKVKTPQLEMMRKGVMYRVPCMDCEGSYIGETGRNLQKRLGEY